MLCKFCKAEMEDDRLYCPECGKRQDAKQEEPETKKTAKDRKAELFPVIAGIAAVLAVACLLLVILLSNKDSNIPSGDGTQATTDSTKPIQQEVTEGKFVDAVGTVVATFEDASLTMETLQMFYVSAINSFLEEYGSNVTTFGLDISKPLSEQKYPYEGAENWEEFFRDLALERWKSCVSLRKMAQQQGYKMSDDMYKQINDYMDSLEDIAKEGRFASVKAMIQKYYGEACDLESYKNYMTMDTEANDFYYSVLSVTDEQVKEYFVAHKDELAEKEITENGNLVSSVRHILIAPKGGTKSEDGKTTVYSDEEWAACQAEAEKVLKEWKDGDATEASFAALVKKYTADDGSATTGGLYENVADNGQYVEQFQNWAVDPSRKTGETGIVKTQFGYHIMYFVKGEQEHIYFSRILLQNERIEEMSKNLGEYLKDKEMVADYEKIVLQNVHEVEKAE